MAEDGRLEMGGDLREKGVGVLGSEWWKQAEAEAAGKPREKDFAIVRVSFSGVAEKRR